MRVLRIILGVTGALLYRRLGSTDRLSVAGG
jgi:hypothetical protein